MNGCGGDPRAPLGSIETRTFTAAPTPSVAADRLNSAIYDLKTNYPAPSDSGVIRIEVSITIDLQILSRIKAFLQESWLRHELGACKNEGRFFFFLNVGICHVVGCGRTIDLPILILILHCYLILIQDYGIGGNFRINKDVERKKKKTTINLIFLVTFINLLSWRMEINIWVAFSWS